MAGMGVRFRRISLPRLGSSTFTYTIADSLGATAMAVLTVSVDACGRGRPRG